MFFFYIFQNVGILLSNCKLWFSCKNICELLQLSSTWPGLRVFSHCSLAGDKLVNSNQRPTQD